MTPALYKRNKKNSFRLRWLAAAIVFATFPAQHSNADTSPATLVPWSYEGMTDSQDSWGTLSPDYALCEIGTQQSPITIAHTEKADLPALSFGYKTGAAKVELIDYVVRVTVEEPNLLTIGETVYKLRHIEFHAPSEHVIRDSFFPMEIQFVHQSFSGDQLILAVLTISGDERKPFNAIAEAMPVKAGSVKNISFNPASLLPGSFGYYAYTGSLTHPPCTEGVEWRILKTPLSLSNNQMNAIINVIGRTARLEQPAYMRVIKETRY